MERQNPEELANFLFTDVEGSTVLVRRLGSHFQSVMRTLNRLLREAIAQSEGVVVDNEGDAFFAMFRTPRAAIVSAVRIHAYLRSESWPDDVEVLVRVGVHTGEATRTEEGYVGLDIHRAARIAALGHGGQTLVSRPTYELVRDRLPEGLHARSLGRYALKDFDEPEEIFQIEVRGMPSDFPPLRSHNRRPNNLPGQLTSFVGRRHEVTAVLGLLDAGRLVTLTGVGGIGKTRLALQVASKAIENFIDGVFLVRLSPVGDPSLVISTIASTLGLHDSGEQDPWDSLLLFLSDKSLLLVLDNFEHLMESAVLVSDLLAAAPKLKVLVTSRELLQLQAEAVFSVPPMRMGDGMRSGGTHGESDAIRLFIDRAQAVEQDFALTEENEADIEEICTRLEGLPLAIELAAARLRMFQTREIAQRLTDQLPVLGTGPRDSPTRQRTLEATVGWSYGLLGSDAQPFFRRLSVFRGGWTTSFAQRVCNPAEKLGETSELLASLIDKSLVTTDRRDPLSTRFRALEVVRTYAMARLIEAGESSETRRRHAETFLSLAESSEGALTTTAQIDALERLDLEHDNLREAIRFSLESSDAERALRLAAALWRFWHLRGYLGEGRALLEGALNLSGADSLLRERARALTALGGVAYWQRDHPAAERAYEESLAISHRITDLRAEAGALHDLAFMPMVRGDIPAAEALFSRSRSLFTDLDDEQGIANATSGLAYVELLKGNYEQSRTLGERSIEGFIRCDYEFGRLNAISILGKVARETGDSSRALELLKEATLAYSKVGNATGLTWVFQEIAALTMAKGDARSALVLSAACVSLQKKIGGGVTDSLLRLQDPRAEAQGSLTDEEIVEAWTSGENLGVEEAVQLVLRI